MALLGVRINAEQALSMGLVHQLANDENELDKQLNQTIKLALKCAPDANKVTKALLHDVEKIPMADLLDNAAINFAKAVASEGKEGAEAFIQKRSANWVQSTSK